MIISNHNEELHAQTQIFWAQQGADGFLFLIHSLSRSRSVERGAHSVRVRDANRGGLEKNDPSLSGPESVNRIFSWPHSYKAS